MAGFVVRPFSPDDAHGCAGIFDRAWRVAHPFAPRRITLSVFAEETEAETLFVAVGDNDEIAGFSSLYEPQGFVHHLYVEPRLRNRGIGRALLDRAVTAAGGSATLKCQLGNQTGLGFYRHLGWTEVVAGTNEYGAWITLLSPRMRA
jgi:GNAT superfamily N-acetyltransferase